MPSKKRLGYWLSDRKCKKLSLPEIEKALSDRNIETVKIDLNQSLSSQGPFDAILHKLTDIIVEASLGIEDAQDLLENFQNYVLENPKVLLIDPIDSLRTLIDRNKTYTIIQNSELRHESSVFVPPFVALEYDDPENIQLLRKAQVTFPLVCKPIIAHGTRTKKNGVCSAHQVPQLFQQFNPDLNFSNPKIQGSDRFISNGSQMVLLFNESGLSECTYPCVLQSFVNHNAVLYKLFAFGDRYFMVERPSIKDLYADKELQPIHFDSGKISKVGSDSELTFGQMDQVKIHKPNIDILDQIVYEIHESMGLGLFGVDVVIESSTGRYGIIDINAFPGYDGVPEFAEHLADFIRRMLDKREDGKGGIRDEMKITSCARRIDTNGTISRLINKTSVS